MLHNIALPETTERMYDEMVAAIVRLRSSCQHQGRLQGVMTTTTTNTVNPAWTVEPGYEPVRDAFVKGMGSFGYGGGAYCAYVDGRPVVDLWGGNARDGEPWQADTATVLMSATKSFGSMCMQILVDRGQIDVDEKVATYWPEYAQNGKESTTVRQLLLHTGGVVGFDQMDEVLRYDGTGWGDLDVIAARLAESVPSFPPGTKHTYHALTIGWLVAEIIRRVDGRTLGRFFAEEIAGPLGLDAWIGLPEAELPRVAYIHDIRLESSAQATPQRPGVDVGRRSGPATS